MIKRFVFTNFWCRVKDNFINISIIDLVLGTSIADALIDVTRNIVISKMFTPKLEINRTNTILFSLRYKYTVCSTRYVLINTFAVIVRVSFSNIVKDFEVIIKSVVTKINEELFNRRIIIR